MGLLNLHGHCFYRHLETLFFFSKVKLPLLIKGKVEVVSEKLEFYKFLAVVIFVIFSFFQYPTYSIGVRAHIEIGIEAVKDYIINFEDQVTGLADLFRKPEIYSAFYAGCAFPDWGYGGINPDAGEASHWNGFMTNYAEVLKEKQKSAPRNEFENELAFFLGIIVHNISDIPWHFDDEENKSFITSANEYGGTTHQDSELALDMFLFAEKELPYPVVTPLYFPYDTILETFKRCGIEVSLDQVKAGCTREQAYLTMGPLMTMGLYQKMKSDHKWVYEHYYDYYYGGIRHCASAVSAFMKYYYSLIMGNYFIQRSHDYSPYVRRNNDYVPLKGIRDATFSSSLSSIVSGKDQFLLLSDKIEDRKGILFWFELPRDLDEFRSAYLWLYIAEIKKLDAQNTARVAISAVLEPWVENDDSTFYYREDSGARDSVIPSPRCGEPTFVDIPIKLGWIRLDISKFLRDWLDGIIENNGICLSLFAENELVLKFYSSEAFKIEEGLFSGGDLLAYRPAVYILRK